MRILVLTNLYPPHGTGEYEERCQKIVRGLQQAGHTVRVLTSDYAQPGVPFVPEPGVLRRLYLHGYGGSPFLPMRDLFQVERANHHIFKEELFFNEPDLIHIWNMAGLPKSLLHAAESAAARTVYDIGDHWIDRGLRNDPWLSWWNDPALRGRLAWRWFLRTFGVASYISRYVPLSPVRLLKLQKSCFVSDFLRKQTVLRGFPLGTSPVIHPGIECDRYVWKGDHMWVRKLLWTGRIHPERDPATALQSLASTVNRLPENMTIDFRGQGDSSYLKSLKAEAERLGVAKRVNFAPLGPREHLNVYARYDAYIYSSNCGEAFPAGPLEAMASGLPVIVCPDGGAAEQVEDGVHGFHFKAGHPESLSRAILRLIQSPDAGKAMAWTARGHVESRFHFDHYLRAIEKFLQETIVQPATGSIRKPA